MILKSEFWFVRVGRKLLKHGALPLYLKTKREDDKISYTFGSPVKGVVEVVGNGCVLKCDEESFTWVVMLEKDDTDSEDSKITWIKGGDVYSLGYGVFVILAYVPTVYFKVGSKVKGHSIRCDDTTFTDEKEYVLEIYEENEEWKAELLEISCDLYEYLTGEKI